MEHTLTLQFRLFAVTEVDRDVLHLLLFSGQTSSQLRNITAVLRADAFLVWSAYGVNCSPYHLGTKPETNALRQHVLPSVHHISQTCVGSKVLNLKPIYMGP